MNDLTFILPTRNRKYLAERAVRSCLDLNTSGLSVMVLVIDGSSTDGTRAHLESCFEGQAVTIVDQPSAAKGFMSACYFGVSLLQTKYATFMYDDDLVSQYLGSFYEMAVKSNITFAMGFGAEYPTDEIYPFSPITGARRIYPLDMLASWYGDNELKFTYMPYNPICCMATSEVLRAWVGEVQTFGGRSYLRRHLILDRNIGGDLLIFLSSLLAAGDDILLADAVVGQFSTTPGSISLTTNVNDLRIGYWVTRIWAIERLLAQGLDQRLLNRMAGYIVVAGLFFCLTDLRQGRVRWSGPMLREILALGTKIGWPRLVLGTLWRLWRMILDRVTGRAAAVRSLSVERR